MVGIQFLLALLVLGYFGRLDNQTALTLNRGATKSGEPKI